MKTFFKNSLFFAFIVTLPFVHSNADDPEISGDQFRMAVNLLTSPIFKNQWRKVQNTEAFAELKDYLSTHKDVPEFQGLNSFIENLDKNLEQKSEASLGSFANDAMQAFSANSVFSLLSRKIQKGAQAMFSIFNEA